MCVYVSVYGHAWIYKYVQRVNNMQILSILHLININNLNNQSCRCGEVVVSIHMMGI